MPSLWSNVYIAGTVWNLRPHVTCDQWVYNTYRNEYQDSLVLISQICGPSGICRHSSLDSVVFVLTCLLSMWPLWSQVYGRPGICNQWYVLYILWYFDHSNAEIVVLWSQVRGSGLLSQQLEQYGIYGQVEIQCGFGCGIQVCGKGNFYNTTVKENAIIQPNRKQLCVYLSS